MSPGPWNRRPKRVLTDGSGSLSFTAPNPSVGVISYDMGTKTPRYQFTGPGLDGTELNPTLYVVRGQTYIFMYSRCPSFPAANRRWYWSGSLHRWRNRYERPRPASLSRTINWEVQMGAPSTIFHQCTAHTAMAGTIKILDGSGSAVAPLLFL